MTYFGCVNKFAQHVYFLANLKYANELLKHMSRGFICTCPPCDLKILSHMTTYLGVHIIQVVDQVNICKNWTV